MRAIWKGSISFSLVNIPISLYSATKREELNFRLLRKSDLSPINYKRVAEADGKEVPWEEIVKGYEHEKGKFVVLKEEDFRRAGFQIAELNFGKIEEQLAAGIEACLNEVLDHLMLGVNGDAVPGESHHVDAMAVSVEAQVKSPVDHALLHEPFADAGMVHQVHGALFQNSRADASFNVIPALVFDDDRFYSGQMQQMRQHESSRPGADNSNLSAELLHKTYRA